MAVPSLRFQEFGDNWLAKRLGEVIDFLPGYAFKSQLMNTEGKGFQLIKMSNVYQNDLLVDRNPSFIEEIEPKQKKFELIKNDVVLTLTGTVGKQDFGYSATIPESNKYYLNQRVLRLRGKANKSDSIFVRNLVLNDRFRYFFFAEAKGGTGNQANVGVEDLKQLRLNLPSLPEQRKIADFLSAVDEKIRLLTAKKEKLETYKKGVMQKLFPKAGQTNPELRFKRPDGSSFPDWEEKRLGEIGSFLKGKGVSKSDIDEVGINECIRYGELYTSYGEVIEKVYSKTNQSLEESILSETNDVLIPASGETQIDIATASSINKKGVVLGGDINVYRTNQNGSFIAYQLCSARKVEVARLSQGISVIHLYSSQLKGLLIGLPSKEEQDRIVVFLLSIDHRISGYSEEINQMKDFKKGLLQQMFV